MLVGLFVAPAISAVREALASARADGPIAVVGNAKLATALGAERDVIPVGLSVRAAKKLPRAIPSLDTVEPASLAAVVGVELAVNADWPKTIERWSRVVRDGGAIVIVDRGKPYDASRRALCGGLAEIEQRQSGRAVVTSGLVSHL